MINHEEGVHSVHGRNPNHAAPADVVAGAIVLDVHGAEVSSLPPKELSNVHSLHHNGSHNGTGNIAVQLVLLESIAEDSNLPKHHTESAVGELLHVPAEDTWVQFSAPKEVDDQIAVSATILGRRKVQTLDDQKDAEENGEQVHGGQDLAHVVVHVSRVELASVSQSKQCKDGNQITLKTVGIVHWDMAGWGDGGLEDLARHGLHQEQLEGHVA